MAILLNIARELIYNRRGQGLVEYALMGGFVAVAAGAVFPPLLMPGVSTIFSKLEYYFLQAGAQGS
jgi:hypothetical protein